MGDIILVEVAVYLPTRQIFTVEIPIQDLKRDRDGVCFGPQIKEIAFRKVKEFLNTHSEYDGYIAFQNYEVVAAPPKFDYWFR